VAFDNNGTDTSLTYPNGRQVDYAYDDVGRVTKIEENTGGADILRYAYKGGYIATTTFGDGTNGVLQWLSQSNNSYQPLLSPMRLAKAAASFSKKAFYQK